MSNRVAFLLLQASLFLASGVLVMFGSMTLIVLNWIYGDAKARGDGH